VALIHDYLVQYGGAEKTLEAIIELFPDAPIYTSVYKPENFSRALNSKEIITPKAFGSVFRNLPALSKYLTFLNPLVFESFDLSGYDIIISDSSSYAKGVLTKPDQLHISYIHTPPRFLYKYSVENTKRNRWYFYPFVLIIDHFLRMWDFSAAQRPDYLVANSKEIQGRIKKFYKRNSTVINPPVELITSSEKSGDAVSGKKFYLAAGRLVAYKNFDLVIKAFNKLPDLTLYVIGTGSEESKLKTLASDNIIFLGRVSDEEKHKMMGDCLGLVNAVEDEDFGIVPVEVLSHGRPVLVHKSAGHLETVIDGKTGMFFDNLSVERLVEKVRKFDKKIKDGGFNPREIKASTTRFFSKDNFKHNFYEFVMHKWKKHVQQFAKIPNL